MHGEESFIDLFTSPSHWCFEIVSGTILDLILLAIGAFFFRPLWDRWHKSVYKKLHISHKEAVTSSQDEKNSNE